MTSILGYCDPISVAPGQTLRVMVSCQGSGTYDAQVVRLLNPQAGPPASAFRTELVTTPANGCYPSRFQPIYAGSFGAVPADPRINELASFSVQVLAWATTPGRTRQALLGTWCETTSAGFGLGLDERGALSLRLGDGTGQRVELTSGVPLLARRWYQLSGCYDAPTGLLTIAQTPLPDRSFHAEPEIHREMRCRLDPTAAHREFLFAAWHVGAADRSAGEPLVGGHFNGKLERPRLAQRALAPAELTELVGAGPVRAALASDVVASWDFAIEIPSEDLKDTSANALHGRVVNLPARAMTGHNWTGEHMDWTRAPEQYGAIHFHDDDLVDANWASDFTFTVDDALRSGIYAVQLRAEESEFWVPFFVRPPQARPVRASRSSPPPRAIPCTATIGAALPRPRRSFTTAA